MIDRAAVQHWLDAYVQAWLTYDPAAIGALFTDDAEYRWHPWDTDEQVARGRDAIVAAWLAEPDIAGAYQGQYRPLLVDGKDAVAAGITRYYVDASRQELDSEFHNLWVLRFTDDGHCSAFTEWFMRTPSADPDRG
jgi:ketosteroid isomerase-like protein